LTLPSFALTGLDELGLQVVGQRLEPDRAVLAYRVVAADQWCRRCEPSRVCLLAYFERPGTSNGPTEALNGRLEHLRGSALGFRNLTNYIARSLVETGGFRPHLHPGLR
jgi:hypothetical protein